MARANSEQINQELGELIETLNLNKNICTVLEDYCEYLLNEESSEAKTTNLPSVDIMLSQIETSLHKAQINLRHLLH